MRIFSGIENDFLRKHMVYYSIVKRRVFFWVLVALFFVVTPLLISYALGYRYSFQRGVFVYAGSLTVSSNPKTINIRIDAQPAPKGKQGYLNNSYHIDGVHPGEYLLEASSPGFSSWSKRVQVHSGVSTEFWNVLLARDSYEAKELSGDGVQRFFLSPRRNVVAYTLEKDGEFSIAVLNTETNEVRQIFASREWRYEGNGKENIEWSPQSDALIIPVVSFGTNVESGKKQYVIVYLETGATVKLADIVSIPDIHAVRWSPSQRNFIYFISESKLFRVDISNPAQALIISDDVSGYDVGSGSLTVIQKTNALLFRYALNGESVRQISAAPLFDAILDDTSRVVAYDEQRIAVLRSDGTLSMYNEGAHETYSGKIGNAVMDVQFSDDGKKLLYWSEKEIFVYYLRDWEAQPRHLEGEILDVARFFDPVRNVHWTKDYEHVLYVHDGFIKGIELDKRDKQNIFTVYALRDVASSIVFSDIGNEKVYFIDSKEKNGERHLFSIDFPEKSGLFNF